MVRIGSFLAGPQPVRCRHIAAAAGVDCQGGGTRAATEAIDHSGGRTGYGPFQKNCNILRIFRSGKGDRPLLPERPAGCCAQKGSVPFLSVRYFDSVAVFLR